MTSVIVHGHFYQPPRENPWTGVVEHQPTAAPSHDWNVRVHEECYRPNAFARILDSRGQTLRVVNNYSKLSFDFGPTLLRWMEGYDPDTYARILEADRESCQRLGHGNAIAHGYHHSILPLLDDRDRRTEIRWGLADFRHRFGREAEAMWLPEAACNDATLADLVDEGMRWVLLAPQQVDEVRSGAGATWRMAERVESGRPYRWLHPDGSGRSLAVFFYDGELAGAAAFGDLLESSQRLIQRLCGRVDGGPGLVHLATDGESFGHHKKFGDLTLAHALVEEAPRRGLRPTNYSEVLDRIEPREDVRVSHGDDGRGSSWSCAHGVARWRRPCGCRTGGDPEWTQEWRKPLREAVEFLHAAANHLFEERTSAFLDDPWAARDAYIEVVNAPDRAGVFFEARSRRPLDPGDRRRLVVLYEMQRHSLMTFTSCGWFFSDLAGIETVQVLRYAGRVLDFIDLLGGESPRAGFLDRLASAWSNEPEHGNGADLFRREVEPLRNAAGRRA